MADADKQDAQTGEGEHELPEAFIMNVGKEVSHLAQPAAGGSAGELDKVREGSEESFPASDPPSVMPPTTVGSAPVKPEA